MISFPAAFAIISTVAVLMGKTAGSPVKYDQRQEGDLNVRTDVEDVVFVVVPPKDLINAGMGLVAATAADLLRKNYGGIGPERWPQRTSSKLGFVPLEKSPYKIDLEKSEVQVKKISQAGDPNRYNIHEGKLPVKLAPEVVESSSKVPVQQTTENAVAVTEKLDQMMSTTEGKTVKKDLNSGLKEEEKKKEIMKEDMKTENMDAKLEKNSKPEMDMKKTETKLEKKSKPEAEMKKSDSLTEKKSKPEMDTKASDAKLEKNTKPETDIKKTDMVTEKKSKPESEMKKSEVNATQEGLTVIGDFSEEPASIFRLEGCGPDAYRSSTGKCIIKTTEKGRKMRSNDRTTNQVEVTHRPT